MKLSEVKISYQKLHEMIEHCHCVDGHARFIDLLEELENLNGNVDGDISYQDLSDWASSANTYELQTEVQSLKEKIEFIVESLDQIHNRFAAFARAKSAEERPSFPRENTTFANVIQTADAYSDFENQSNEQTPIPEAQLELLALLFDSLLAQDSLDSFDNPELSCSQRFYSLAIYIRMDQEFSMGLAKKSIMDSFGISSLSHSLEIAQYTGWPLDRTIFQVYSDYYPKNDSCPIGNMARLYSSGQDDKVIQALSDRDPIFSEFFKPLQRE